MEIRRGEQPEKEAQRETMNGPVTLAVRSSAPAKLHKSESAARNVKLAATRVSTIASIMKHGLVFDFSGCTVQIYSMLLNNVTAVTAFTSLVEPYISESLI